MPHSSLGNASLYDLTSRKRNTLRQSSLIGYGRCRGGGRCRWRCPARKQRSICSNVVGTGGPIIAGGRLCVSLTSFCISFSTLDTSPALASHYHCLHRQRRMSDTSDPDLVYQSGELPGRHDFPKCGIGQLHP